MPARDPPHLLILGGTGEAAALAHAAAMRFGTRIRVTTALAGRTAQPPPLPGALRIGGFGGAAGLADYLRQEGVGAVIDATHPFAARISAHAHAACMAAGTPLLRLDRPPWRQADGDRWIEAGNVADAARIAGGLGTRIWLTLGKGELGAFADVAAWFLVRLIEPPAARLPLGHYAVVTGRGPFALEDEIRLIERHRIDALVAKASGGQATYAKLAAARRQSIPVVMIRRPEPPKGPAVQDIPAALAWLEAAFAG